jgi:large subunit ribosomal protein L25
MKSLEIIGFKRANLGKVGSQELRDEASVPCVLYGGKEQLHFSVPMFQFRDIVYTPNTYLFSLQVGKTKYKCILKEVQFHPVNDMIIHADFFEVSEDKPVVVNVPLKLEGNSIGAQKGGKVVQNLPKLKIKALPKDLPDFVSVDISHLDLGKVARVKDAKVDNFQIINSKDLPVASIAVPRGLKGKDEAAKK